jgi:hypothetical protein
MKQGGLVILFSLFLNSLFAQHPVGDKLEQLYFQGHYGLIYRKAKKLRVKEETKSLIAPTYYFTLTTLQKSANPYWLKRNLDEPNKAIKLLTEIKNTVDGKLFLEAHSYELYGLKQDLSNWLSELNQTKLKKYASGYAQLIDSFFSGFEGVNFAEGSNSISSDISDYKGLTQNRINLAKYAKQQLGVKYTWGGEDPSGFDCSGFTQYVMKHEGLIIPRTAGDQYAKSTKVDVFNVQCGDLVFFKNDGRISHVGLVISKKGELVKMIHASSSLGISIIEINQSSYWKQRLFAYGTFLNNR